MQAATTTSTSDVGRLLGTEVMPAWDVLLMLDAYDLYVARQVCSGWRSLVFEALVATQLTPSPRLFDGDPGVGSSSSGWDGRAHLMKLQREAEVSGAVPPQLSFRVMALVGLVKRHARVEAFLVHRDDPATECPQRSDAASPDLPCALTGSAGSRRPALLFGHVAAPCLHMNILDSLLAADKHVSQYRLHQDGAAAATRAPAKTHNGLFRYASSRLRVGLRFWQCVATASGSLKHRAFLRRCHGGAAAPAGGPPGAHRHDEHSAQDGTNPSTMSDVTAMATNVADHSLEIHDRRRAAHFTPTFSALPTIYGIKASAPPRPLPNLEWWMAIGNGSTERYCAVQDSSGGAGSTPFIVVLRLNHEQTHPSG